MNIQRHPQITSWSLSYLFERILDKKLHITSTAPSCSGRALKLFDSIARGIPIGSLTILRTSRQLPILDLFGPELIPRNQEFKTQGPKTQDYLIDGRWRIRWLLQAFKNINTFRDPSPICFNLENSSFCFGSANHITTWPLNQIWSHNFSPLLEGHVEVLEMLHTAFRQYSVPVIMINTDDEKLIEDMMERL